MVREYELFVPLSEHSKVDLIGVNGQVLKFQIKYSSNGIVRNYSIARNQKRTTYTKFDFDYYAVFLSELDVVIYISSDSPPGYIRYKYPASSCKVWWYEDFLVIGNKPEKRFLEVNYKPSPKRRKVNWPDKDYLEREVWKRSLAKIGKDFGVSRSTVKRWCNHYGIINPGHGDRKNYEN